MAITKKQTQIENQNFVQWNLKKKMSPVFVFYDLLTFMCATYSFSLKSFRQSTHVRKMGAFRPVKECIYEMKLHPLGICGVCALSLPPSQLNKSRV